MLTKYVPYDTVEVTCLDKGDIFEYNDEVYSVDAPIMDDGQQVTVPVLDAMDDPDVLFIDAFEEVNLLREVDDD